jgi:hypothetical protein
VNEITLSEAWDQAAKIVSELRQGRDPKAKRAGGTLREVLDGHRAARSDKLPEWMTNEQAARFKLPRSRCSASTSLRPRLMTVRCLAVAVAIGFDHARIFAFHALADRCSDYTQMPPTTFFIARPALD